MTSHAREPRTDQRMATQRRVSQRLIEADALKSRQFPGAPKSTWKAALAAGHQIRATYAVGPWLGANLVDVLESECPSIALWIVHRSGARLRALWIKRSGKWSFHRAMQTAPDARLLNATEMKEWIKSE